MSCPFAVDDGAYVLGALSPAERAEFERHLASCPICREAVANLAVLPGLLGRIDAATAAGAVRPDQAHAATIPPGLLDRLLAAAALERDAQRRAQRARRLRYILAACVAAIVLAAGGGLGVHVLENRGTTVAQTPMAPAAGAVPVTAQIGVTPVYGGSKITMTCRYSSDREGRWVLRLVVFDHSATAGEQVGTWTAGAGDEISMTATTHLAPNEIDHIELQKADRTPLLTWFPT